MKTRQELICWNCDEQFSTPLPAEIPDTLIVYCSLCDAECIIDFTTTREKIKIVYRGKEVASSIEINQLPEIMKTQKPD